MIRAVSSHGNRLFRASKWFTRGWTLHELLAPVSVEFFSREDERLDDKKPLEQQVHEITRMLLRLFLIHWLTLNSITSMWTQNRCDMGSIHIRATTCALPLQYLNMPTLSQTALHLLYLANCSTSQN